MKRSSDAAQTRGGGAHRSPFDRCVAQAELRVSQAPFFFVCAGIVVAWLISLPWWTDLEAWQFAFYTVASVFMLLLVVLFENAGRRASEASQEKLDVIAEALAALLASSAFNDPELRTAAERLREAVGREERY
ncbi:low affinity iron permease family protein [Rhodococcus globerulus]|uniref:Low affinity iron permease family protein n=1 Tax=Rhodococcus globerulus TaxID=33008 RepID=A0ABU4C5T0_RHOGO|nr:low affinity iron permease family protein [Rhodococcus globerulus]MDV6271629.1 low affinity iron permease family protein [Rhodococcus globerulus]